MLLIIPVHLRDGVPNGLGDDLGGGGGGVVTGEFRPASVQSNWSLTRELTLTHLLTLTHPLTRPIP